jgi:hypothetical protein
MIQYTPTNRIRNSLPKNLGFEAKDILSRLDALVDKEICLTDIARAITNEYKKPDVENMRQKLESALAETDSINARNRVRSIQGYIKNILEQNDYNEALETTFRAALGQHYLPEARTTLKSLIKVIKNEA